MVKKYQKFYPKLYGQSRARGSDTKKISLLYLYAAFVIKKSRKENPQKLTQLSSRSHPRHLVGKRTAQKDTIIDITSDSQVNSNFPYRWSPASLTFNNYFYLFLYLYITWITINNNAPHLKSPKNQNRRAALGRPAIKITGVLELVCGRPTLALRSALVHRRNNYELQKQLRTTKTKRIKHKQKAKRAAGLKDRWPQC